MTSSRYRTILALVGHPLVFDARRREQKMELVPYPVELVVTEKRDGYKIALSHVAEQPAVFLEPETTNRYRVIDLSQPVLKLQEILGHGGLTVPRQAKERVVALLKEQNLSLPIRTDIAAVELPAIEGQTTPVLQMQSWEDGLKVAMVVRPFGAAGPYYLAGQGGPSVLAVIEGQRWRANRNLAAERSSADSILAALPTLHRSSAQGSEWLLGDIGSALEFLLEVKRCPQPVLVEWPEGEKLRVGEPVTAAAMTLKLNRARDWFQIDGEVRVDEDLVVDMQDLLSRLGKAHGRFVPLENGRFVALTRQFQAQLERLEGVSEEDHKGRRLAPLGTVAVQDLVEEAGSVEADCHWRAFVDRLRAASAYDPVVPSMLQAELRDYQIEGFRWLSRLFHWGAGACLADDMGLGKTVQAIAVMVEQAPQGPCLVLAPTSVCHNWEHELARFAPTLAVRRLGATSNRVEQIEALAPMDVLVASYGLLHLEADRLADVAWRMVVFDEAQAIKNAATKRAQACQRLTAAFRLALTGTPVENYLDELWSLFNIVNPGLLGSRERFQRRFAAPIERKESERHHREGALQSLRALIRPFILRRTKSAVLSELPPRTEVTLEVDLPAEERAFYEALRRKALEALSGPTEGLAGRRRLHILAEITRLRRACCHPGLVDPQTELPGAKLETVLDLVDELIRNHHKALVFSQFVGHLERVGAALDQRGIRYQYLDGSTPAKDRERRVAAFQAGEGALFLISLKAGGTGLNLTAADYVIHLDPWWNPAVEDQASDRAHRIGQQRPVTVYRLIVQDSVEEKILALHRRKRDLAADLLEGSEMSGRLSDDELLDLIRS
jgi:superfamily II DNA or RNA helicase